MFKALLSIGIFLFLVTSATATAKEENSTKRSIASIINGVWGCASIKRVPGTSKEAMYLSQGKQKWVLSPKLYLIKDDSHMDFNTENLYSSFLNDYCADAPVVLEGNVICCIIKKQ